MYENFEKIRASIEGCIDYMQLENARKMIVYFSKQKPCDGLIDQLFYYYKLKKYELCSQ